ncbi:MAG TPA: hypothetical protein VIN72_01475 [Lutibacter sp.]
MSLLKSSYKILKEYNLIVESHTGSLDLKSYIDFVERMKLDPLFSIDMNFYVDLSNVVVTASIDDVKIYNNFSESIFKSENKRKVALITDSPNQMVFATLFKNSNTQKSKVIEIFSTKESAIQWLNTNLNKEEILNILSNIKREHSLK